MVTKAFFSFGVLLMCIFAAPVMAQQSKQPTAEMNKEILRLVNKHRTDMGLKPLVNEPHIIKEAEQHSKNMASGKTSFGHDGFDGRTNRLTKAIKHAGASAENVAYGSRTAVAVVDMWLQSKGHRENIEGDYTLTGLGIAQDKNGTLYFTQIFIKN